jgi:HAD superfamily hydrolase (TIGR01549 family)
LGWKTRDLPRPIHEYKRVLFDCDDTILETSEARWEVMRKVASEFEVVVDDVAIRRVWGQPFHRMIGELLPGVDYEDYVDRYRRAMAAHEPKATPGALDLLEYLEGRVDMQIVSSGSHELVVQDLEALRMRHFFSCIYGCEDVPFHKPDPRVIEPAIEGLRRRWLRQDIPLPDVVYIGDSARDYEASIGNHVDFIGVTSGLETRDDLMEAGVETIVASLDELVPREERRERRSGAGAARSGLRPGARVLQAVGIRDGLGARARGEKGLPRARRARS